MGDSMNPDLLMRLENECFPQQEDSGMLEGHLRYESIKPLGKGAQGSVHLALDRFTNEKVAIKFLPRGTRVIEKAQRELLNHRKFWHAHVIQFYEVFLTDRHVCIVMEYAPGGSLSEYIGNNILTEDGARFFFQQLVFAVKYCHHMGVANRDIKLENTLLSDPDQRLLKLCDFGLSKDETSVCRTRVGTPNYLAPEIITMPREGTYDGKQSDVWCCGIMLYAMLCRCFPFERPEEKKLPRKDAMLKLMERIVRGEWNIPSNVSLSDGCKSLLRGILQPDPTRRLTIEGIQAHPWYRIGLPEGTDNSQYPQRPEDGLQSVNSIVDIIQEASNLDDMLAD